MSNLTRLATIGIVITLAAFGSAIKCWQCGKYTDGVGSITPCVNQTAAKLEQCPHHSRYCIKYVSELTTVRDCVQTCSEKEWWGARTFCCETDECNSAFTQRPQLLAFATTALACILAR